MRRRADEPIRPDLPPSLQGADGFVRLVQAIGLRVSVVGTRGKSTVAVALAEALRRRNLAVHTNAPAAPDDPDPSLLDHAYALAGLERDTPHHDAATRQAIRRDWAVQALVLRNPRITAAGQRAFHANVALPHYVLLTNLRRDPHGHRPPSPATAARAVARAVTPGATLVCGEGDPALKAALRRECDRLGVPFLDAAPGRLEVPGGEAVTVIDALLKHRFGAGLQPAETDALRRGLEARFRWAPSTIPGVRFFDAGPIHDVDSTQIALNYLQAQRRHPVTFVAYFRRDRPGRTRSYAPFLAELLNAPDTRQVILAGPGAHAVAARLRRWESQVSVVSDDVASIPRLVRRLQFEGQGGAIVTLANGAPEWPRALVEALHKGTPTPPTTRPPRPEPIGQGLAPRRIARPMVAPAPSMGSFGETFSLARFARPARPSANPAPHGPGSPQLQGLTPLARPGSGQAENGS